MKKNEKYEYEWTDCQTEDTWTHSKDLDEIIEAHTKRKFTNVGYFLLERDGFYVFSAGHTPQTDGKEIQYFHLTFIPTKGNGIENKEVMKNPSPALAKRRAWSAFSAYIRQRDKICATCTSLTTQAGHFLHTTDKNSNPNLGGNELWYNEKNVNGQDSSCNLYKSGNLAEYAVAIEEKWGTGTIQELYKLRRTPRKWTIAELLAVEELYKRKLQ
jgi:hypothetical protein